MLLLFLLFLLTPRPIAPQTLNWSTQIPGTGSLLGRGFRFGNGLVYSKKDDTIWATMDDGSLVILEALTGNLLHENNYMKNKIEKKSWFISCQSSVDVVEVDDKTLGTYAVLLTSKDYEYNTKDWAIGFQKPPEYGLGQQMKSRVAVFEYVNGSLNQKWSLDLDGMVIGTPSFGYNGEKVYVSYNQYLQLDGANYYDHAMKGFLVVIDNNSGIIIDQSEIQHDPLGPVAISNIKIDDEIYFGTSGNFGYAKKGALYKYSSADGLVLFKNTTWSVTNSPVVSQDGETAWFGGTSSTVHGVNLKDGSMWNRKVGNDFRNTTMPVISKVAVTSNGSEMFINSATTHLTSLDAAIGTSKWDSYTHDVNLAGPQISKNSNFVYTIHHREGIVVKATTEKGPGGSISQPSCKDIEGWTDITGFTCSDYENNDWCEEYGDCCWNPEFGMTANGACCFCSEKRRILQESTSLPEYFELSCEKIGGAPGCEDSVEAEFTLSTDGTNLYYGDIFGKIVSLQVADKIPTSMPSVSPTASNIPSSEPSQSFFPSIDSARPSERPVTTPSDSPSSLPTLSNFPTERPTSGPSSKPSSDPSLSPSHSPSSEPSLYPTISDIPTRFPSNGPTNNPTDTDGPSGKPSFHPTNEPTVSSRPSSTPSLSQEPTVSKSPSNNPTFLVEDVSLPSRQPVTMFVPPNDNSGSFVIFPLTTIQVIGVMTSIILIL